MKKKRIIPEEMYSQLFKATCDDLKLKIIHLCRSSMLDEFIQMQILLDAYKILEKEWDKNLQFNLEDINTDDIVSNYNTDMNEGFKRKN